MSSLQRYKRSGGFQQLLSLIETFGPAKKEKFLEMIDAESASWAQALRGKMLTVERIFSWPDDTMVGVFKELPPKSLAFALAGMKDEQKARVQKYMSHAEMRRLDDLIEESKPKPDEIASTFVKVVEQARKMINERALNPEKFDAELLIPEGIEARLDEGGSVSVALASASAPSDVVALAAAAADPSRAPTLEAAQLQRTLAALVKENKALKADLAAAQGKLEQIKKIA